MSARERHAQHLKTAARMALIDAMAAGDNDRLWAVVEDRIGSLAWFAGMDDAAAVPVMVSASDQRRSDALAAEQVWA